MPRPVRPWFRFYTEAVHDPKLRRMTPVQRWVWVAVLAAARQSHTPGVLLVSDTQPMDAHDLADFAAVPIRDVRKAVEAMEAAGMLAVDDAGAWRVTKWNDRQFETDNTTERTRKHRSNGQRRNVPKSSAGTPPETETDTDPQSSTGNSRPEADSRHDDRVEIALAVLADRDLTARRDAKGNVGDPISWRNTAIDRRRPADGPRLATLADQHPDATPADLATLLEPPTPRWTDRRATPLDGQQAAERARAERHLRAVRGEACQACQDTGWTDDEDGNVVACQHPTDAP